ncbi:isoprenylcysteine carboxylmethyltransferase family protein [Devosia rhodophyticola]|uniref:Isoprenylcysteine carboxylmethyltransferase family protein n=1 Tax=Devosia rhodophyticola TaxID=3026423 RepID=A0ABY7YX83_9HYPH|nr:isoprenylcysteine carboxylmethyltransferase family protein [Devosia rhodophyticola]WDR05988.1 isoprenylcysteine carboxylmethyltransferase family protein [Devosia rhodophyticola]
MSKPPDFFAALTVGSALLLEWLAPLNLLPDRAFLSPVVPIGTGIAVAGLGLEILAARVLVGAGTTARPFREPSKLVTNGIFLISRNPFYIGMILLISGTMVAFSLDWVVLTIPVFWFALDRMVVPIKEQQLLEAFGSRYQAYAQKTPRWLFRRSTVRPR